MVANGYDWGVVVHWGDPVLPGAPAWDPATQTPASQAAQFGYDNDLLAVLPLGSSS